MKKISFLIGAIVFMLAGCTIQGDRTDAEMFEAANKVFQDYLFEYRIDGSLFSQPIIVTRKDGAKSYQWFATGSEKNSAGIEVIVQRNRETKPIWSLIGNKEAWIPLVNTKKINQ